MANQCSRIDRKSATTSHRCLVYISVTGGAAVHISLRWTSTMLHPAIIYNQPLRPLLG